MHLAPCGLRPGHRPGILPKTPVLVMLHASNIPCSSPHVPGPQNCKWNFLAFSGTFKVHLGVQEDAAARSLLFTLVESSFMRSFKGSWIVKEAPSRTSSSSSGSGSGGCLIEHQLSVAPSVPVPPPVSFYTRGIFMRQVERVLLDLKEEAEARWGRGPVEAVVEAERVTVKVGSG